MASGQQLSDRTLNPQLRRPDSCEKLHAAASKPRWTLRELFLPGSSPPGRVRIATTPDSVRPEHGAAIAEVAFPERNRSEEVVIVPFRRRECPNLPLIHPYGHLLEADHM